MNIVYNSWRAFIMNTGKLHDAHTSVWMEIFRAFSKEISFWQLELCSWSYQSQVNSCHKTSQRPINHCHLYWWLKVNKYAKVLKANLRALFLKWGQLSLVQVSSKGIDIWQLGIRVHQSTHRLAGIPSLQGLVDFVDSLLICMNTYTQSSLSLLLHEYIRIHKPLCANVRAHKYFLHNMCTCTGCPGQHKGK